MKNIDNLCTLIFIISCILHHFFSPSLYLSISLSLALFLWIHNMLQLKWNNSFSKRLLLVIANHLYNELDVNVNLQRICDFDITLNLTWAQANPKSLCVYGIGSFGSGVSYDLKSIRMYKNRFQNIKIERKREIKFSSVFIKWWVGRPRAEKRCVPLNVSSACLASLAARILYTCVIGTNTDTYTHACGYCVLWLLCDRLWWESSKLSHTHIYVVADGFVWAFCMCTMHENTVFAGWLVGCL